MADILIAEDSATQAVQIKNLLVRAGFGVEVAPNGLAALQAIARKVPDLVLTDLNMPEMNGLELVGAVRSRFPRVPVVLMTAFGSEEIAVRALEAGAASYVPKRNLEKDLIETLRDVLGVVQAARDQAHLAEFLTQFEAHFEWGAEAGAVMPIVARLQAAAAELHLVDETERIRVGVALEAVLQNALGGKLGSRSATPLNGEPARRWHLDAKLARSEAVFVLRHDGPAGDAPPEATANDAAALSGDGSQWWLLAKSFLDEVRLDPGGNQLTLIKRGHR